ncbi:MAG: response regulator, partial [Ignavibacteriales bacterium]|nr:response regulator [Ignavibacteriales bacterium]
MKTHNSKYQSSPKLDPVEQLINIVTGPELKNSHAWKDRSLRVLIVEDIDADAELMELELKRAQLPFVARRVSSREEFIEAIDSFQPDIVLADYLLPQFSALEALEF